MAYIYIQIWGSDILISDNLHAKEISCLILNHNFPKVFIKLNISWVNIRFGTVIANNIM